MGKILVTPLLKEQTSQMEYFIELILKKQISLMWPQKICFFVKTNFRGANLSGFNIGIFPVLNGHTDWVTSVSFSPDGTRIVTGSLDKQAIIWDANTLT